MTNPDTVLYDGRIYPNATERTMFEALAISHGRVSHLGSNVDLLKIAGIHTEKVDLDDKTVLPGFHDSHIHLLSYGMLLNELDLSGIRSIKAIKKRVSRRASDVSPDGWILGRGWDDEKLAEHRYPSRDDIDSVSAAPVFLKRICGHIAVANSVALRKAGIGATTPNPAGGLIDRDFQGKPTGVLKERAIELVEAVIPRSMETTRNALILASKKLAKLGLTTLHCIVSDRDEIEALKDLKRERRIVQFIHAILPSKLLAQNAAQDAELRADEEGFRIGGVKLFLDGSLGARTAALKAPYNDAPNSAGILTMSSAEIDKVAARAVEAGLQLCLHAIGDRAVDLAIQTIIKVSGTDGKRRRHRIEHASLTSRDSLLKMAKEGIVASVQPQFIYSDNWAADRLGRKRLNDLYRLGSMFAAGILVAAGSDCPVEYPNPFEGVWSAVARPGLDDSERLSVSQALAAYTVNAAFASFAEDLTGTLDVGKVANLVVVDRDPFECSLEDLRNTQVLKTMIRGQTVA